jgi:hypothetical protein
VNEHRTALGVTVVGLLLAAATVAAALPLPHPVAVALFAVVVILVGILFFRFNPEGDFWDTARTLGINPWLGVLLVILLAIAFFLVRVSLIGPQ